MYPGFLYKRVLMIGDRTHSHIIFRWPGWCLSCLRPDDTRMTRGPSGWLMSCCGLNGSCLPARNLERWMRDGARGSQDAAREDKDKSANVGLLWWFCDNRSQYVTMRDTPSLSPQQLAPTCSVRAASFYPGPRISRQDHFSQYTGHFLFVSEGDELTFCHRGRGSRPENNPWQTSKNVLRVWAFGCIGIVFHRYLKIKQIQ